MKLTDLAPKFMRYEPPVLSPDGDGRAMRRARFYEVATLAEAQGLEFTIPPPIVGQSRFIVWFADCGIPDDAYPQGYRWPVTGTGFHDLTLTPSILIPGHWHGFIRSGEVTSA